jgi:tetratricopeptide (TPR) repeat protein
VDDLSEVARELWDGGDARGAVASWEKQAELLRNRGELDEALGVATTLLQRTQGANSRLQWSAWYAMAEAHRARGEFWEAARWIRRAVKAHRNLADRQILGADLARLGELAVDRGKLWTASRLWRLALLLLDGEEWAEARQEVLLALAGISAALEQSERAEDYETRADELAKELVARELAIPAEELVA